jgi:hypothetical protein
MISDQIDLTSKVRRSTTPNERRWVFIFACIVMIVTSLPYMLGYAVQGQDYRFTGFVFAVQDGNSYIAKMMGGISGAWLFRTPYTVAEQQGVLMYLPYILLGKLAWPPGLHVQLVMLYHLFRFAAGVLMIRASYDFLAFFVQDIRLRRFGLALIILGGGLGWIFVFLGQDQWLGSLPLEFYSPESFGFLSIFGLPHLAIARACILWTLLIYLRFVKNHSSSRNDVREALKAGFLWFMAGLFQPLTLLVIGVVIVFHIIGLALWQAYLQSKQKLTDWNRLRDLLRFVVFAGILPGLLLIYIAYSTITDPFLSQWGTQNILVSPHIFHYLLAYGVLIPYTWVGGRQLMREDTWVGWLPVGWILLFPILAYFPVTVQRRLPEGVWVVLCVLALLALQNWTKQGFLEGLRRRYLAYPPLLLLFPSTLILWLGGLLSTSNANLPLFRPIDEVILFEYLQKHANPRQVVLSSYETGNPLPAWAPVQVVIGHGPESADLELLLLQVQDVYSSNMSDSQRLGWMSSIGIDYVFWGPAEKELGDWDPQTAGFLHLIQQSGDYSLFEVVPES